MLSSISNWSRRGNAVRQKKPVHLKVESLEDRTVPSGVEVASVNPQDWPMYNHDPSGSRYNHAEQFLGPNNVGNLGIRWSVPTHGPIAGTPAVVNDRVFVADAAGFVYSVDRYGNKLWETPLNVGPTFSNVKITASVLVTNHTVIIGDGSGDVHGLDIETGAVKWTTTPNPHQFAAIWGSATMVGNYVAVGTSSVEEFVAPFIPNYTPTFRGSMALLDPSTGAIVWQTYTISDAESAAGSSGSPIWSTPTYDRATNTIYATTGNNYSQPTQGTSDAFIAFDATTGAIKWTNQRTADDEWTFVYGDTSEAHPDFDFGDSPQVYKLGGRTVVSAGQKSGFFHVVDAITGEQVNEPIQLAPDGTVGGLFADSAVAKGIVYANGTDWPGLLAGLPPVKGIISAVAGDGSHEIWRFETPFSPNISGVAVANDVVYFQSGLDFSLYALDAKTGQQLARVTTGSLSSGPAISRGQIYLGTGDAVFSFLIPTTPLGPGSIIALGLPPAQGHSMPSASPSRTMQGNGTGRFTSANNDFVAAGFATHLGAFTHYGAVTMTPTLDPNVVLISGQTTFVAANGDKLYAQLQGTLNLQTRRGIGTDTWIGGTGRFANVTGIVGLTAQIFADGSFEFELDGIIEF